MEDPENECPICFEKLDKTPLVSLHCCSKQNMHISCYVKTHPKCPLCRDEKNILPVFVLKTDWPRITKVFTLIVTSAACITTALISASCNTPHSN